VKTFSVKVHFEAYILKPLIALTNACFSARFPTQLATSLREREKFVDFPSRDAQIFFVDFASRDAQIFS